MVNRTKCIHTFPCIYPRRQHTKNAFDALRHIIKMKTQVDILAVLSLRVLIENKEQLARTYIEQASDRLHDAVLAKITNSFFTALPQTNLLSF